ncbi:serine/threonine protein kinase [Parvularcula lutaonensis]|uniref:Protein kinase n=1 Tax=Parvularcula lutaonensis TaxID=491923 RepID=A0ABV7M8Z8_9PROT|nr:serine/threonine-protein kinase [Parvularcula lutaonensis]GGY45608.1 hypothetical protein GCM10007148_13280 [Parvularcula lutaonensis]
MSSTSDDDAPTHFLRTSAPELSSGPEPSSEPGTVFGAWRIRRLIARGGMGEVYEVERADGAYEATAALKLVALTDPRAAEQFRRERQALAQLEHPGITRVIDGGTAPDGRPFLVMELVEGTPLSEKIPPELSRDDRLRLFLEICDAVIYAHRAFVLHRDIKPSNILLDKDGRPRLIDFGISVSMDRANPEGGMTALFAAPEQWRGEPASVASDVFSLGLVLYTLLTEKLPKRNAAGGVELPTTEGLSPELQAIIRKATAPDPEDRYSSVDRLASDIRAVLENRPVEAFGGGNGYRFACFVRRNTVLSVTAAALLVSLVGGLTASLVLLDSVAKSRSELAASLAATELALQDAQFTGGQQATTASLMQRAAFDLGVDEEAFTEHYLTAAREAHATWQDEPDAAARVVFTVGRTLLYKNDFNGAVEILKPWIDAGYGDPYWLLQGEGALYVALRNAGREDEALPYARRYLARYAEGPGANTANHAAAAATVAEMTYEESDARAALPVLEKALENEPSPQFRQFLWDKRGRMLERLGDLDGRVASIVEAMKIADENTVGKDIVQDSAYRLRAAEALFYGSGDSETASKIADRVHADLLKYAPNSRDVILSTTLQAEIAFNDGRPADALTLLESILEGAGQRFAPGSLPDARVRWLHAEALAHSGQCQAAREVLESDHFSENFGDDARTRIRVRSKAGRRCVASACGGPAEPLSLTDKERDAVTTSVLTHYFGTEHCNQ